MVNDTVQLKTPTCRHCGEWGIIKVRAVDLERYRAGALIQEAFPEMPIERREQLISGTHPACWDAIFAD